MRFVWLLLVACSVPEIEYEPLAEREPVADFSAIPQEDLDVLFVIDDSPSMADKQANLIANFPNLIARLNLLPGGLPSLHLGVVSTDMGTSGSGPLPPAPAIGSVGNGGCSGTGKAGALTVNTAPVTGAFLSDIRQGDGSRQRNYNGTLEGAFGQMAQLGAGGCGFEQPLRAMQAAFQNPANQGFSRQNAVLAVVFLTDEDDCSVEDPSLFGPETPALGALQSFRCARFGVRCASGGANPDQMNQVGVKTDCSASGDNQLDDVAPYHTFLEGLKPDTSKVVVGAIMGDPLPVEVELRAPPGGGTPIPALVHSCSYTGTVGLEVADPGVRMKDFLDRFGNRSAFSTICQPDLSGGLDQIAQVITRSVGSPCIEMPLADVDPNLPGPQVDCIVEDVLDGAATLIAPCGPAPTSPCWRLEPDATICPAADHLKLVVDRDEPPAPETRTRVSCVVN
jgi:hypothetical protein